MYTVHISECYTKH